MLLFLNVTFNFFLPFSITDFASVTGEVKTRQVVALPCFPGLVVFSWFIYETDTKLTETTVALNVFNASCCSCCSGL